MNACIGDYIYDIAKKLFPICRSITGNGVRETLRILHEYCPDIKICEVPSGTTVFDWTVPKEWNIRDAYVENSRGERVIDFKENNLHVLGYSTPVNEYVNLDELLKHIYTLPEQPDLIPYVTSYYKERWGFCITETQRGMLAEDKYHVVIDSDLKDGSLTYGELLIQGKSKDEIFLSTYICHPSMANNECSGPSLMVALAQYILSMKNRKFSYRIVFIPETIGSITYLSRNLNTLKQCVIAGYNLSCVGDDRTYSMVETRYANTLADKALKNILHFHYPNYIIYSYLGRGSDERQYNAPGVDLPVCGYSRSKYGQYPEYHTSADNMGLISPAGLQGSYEVMTSLIDAMEWNGKYKINCICEPQLGKRGLYPTISKKGVYDEIKSMTNFIAYADGSNDLFDISNIINEPVGNLISVIIKLLDNNLISKC